MILFAININSGGGKILLDQILLEKTFGQFTDLFLDSRYEIPAQFDHKSVNIYRIRPKIIDRIKAELDAFKITKRTQSAILFFGNLPPIMNFFPNSILFLQNAFLLPSISLFNVIRPKLFLRHLYERCVFISGIKNVETIWVQTHFMKNELISWKSNLNIEIKPIVINLPSQHDRLEHHRDIDLLLVTGTQPHKRLFPFLKCLNNSGRSDLKITIVLDSTSFSEFKDSSTLLSSNVEIITCSLREDLFKIYQRSKKILITSKFESYCLPIYEALHFGVEVILPNEKFTTELNQNFKRYDFPKLTDFLKQL